MTLPTPPGAEKRIQTRKPLRLRVDARLLTEQERIDILAGLGHADLDSEALAYSRPRHGMQRASTHDLSVSGLRLAVEPLGDLEPGAALCLDVHLPGEGRVVKLLGDVMWSAKQDGTPVAGLRIAALEMEGLERLRRALQDAD